jgi:hypothetical protein
VLPAPVSAVVEQAELAELEAELVGWGGRLEVGAVEEEEEEERERESVCVCV